MSLKNTTPGTYSAKIVDWGIEEVEQLDGAPKAVVVFDFQNSDDEGCRIKWDGFITKRDGQINKKTVDTLVRCGLNGNFLQLIEGGSGLDTEKELEIEIVKEGEYLRVEWVNEPGGSQFIKKAAGGDIAKKLKGLSLMAGLKDPVKKPFNHAPGADNDGDEKIPF